MAAAIALLHPLCAAYLPAWLRALAGTGTAALTWLAWSVASCSWRLECRGRLWTIEPLARTPWWRPDVASERRTAWRGARLLPGGHRAGSHLVMQFRNEQGRRLSVTVWRGALCAASFSRLHLAMLASATAPPPAIDALDRDTGWRGRALRCVTLHRSRSDEPRS